MNRTKQKWDKNPYEVITEILDGMAEYENRILFLENSLPSGSEPSIEERISILEQTREPIYLSRKQQELVEQAIAGFRFLEKKLNEHIDASKRKRVHKYSIK